MNKRKILVTALALSIIAILSVGTLAWFSDEDSVTNKFYIADSDDTNPDDIFSVDVWEENKVGSITHGGIVYKDILPGDELVKKARVENTGHYDQFIRVIVKISDAEAWLSAVGSDFVIENCFTGFDASVWTNISKTVENDTLTYVLYYNKALAEGEVIELFDEVVIPTSLTQEQAAAFKGGFTIDVKAQAVQTKNVGENAYEAFATVGMGL